MSNFRIISRLDIKGDRVIKGYQMEGFRVVGSPRELSSNYFENGIDEILINDVVASLYGRGQVMDVIRQASQECFIPITVVGGIKSIRDATEIFRNGADKIGINTAALINSTILREISNHFGSQSIVLSIEAKRNQFGIWTTYGNSGRTDFGKSISGWIQETLEFGIGEILITSVDRDGTNLGFDLDLMDQIPVDLPVPVLVSGGISNFKHISEIASRSYIDGIVIGRSLHDKSLAIPEIKNYAGSLSRSVRLNYDYKP